MTARLGAFDSLAAAYRWLEWFAFGSDLETARFCHLEHLRDCRRVLVLGEGDGRFLAQLMRRFPAMRVDCVEASGAMLRLARARLREGERHRVTFHHADALTAQFEAGAYGAVVTLFFLDCFPQEDVARLVTQVQPALGANACWLWADFALPPSGWRHWRAALWLRGLYLFFHWKTALTVDQLPPSEKILQKAGFRLCAEKTFQAGLLRSAVYRSMPATKDWSCC